MLSFMCAGVPSIFGTHAVLKALGFEGVALESFRYRGDGWPGMAKAISKDGRSATMDYNSSWGNILNRHLQFRCKICPDGTGEFADLVCADAWYGKDGYPDFTEREGRSLILVRTAKGKALLESALAASAISVDSLAVDEIAAMQPYQVARKQQVSARLMGTWLRKFTVPKYRRLGLVAAMRTGKLSIWLRTIAGTYKRAHGE
jgi:coenzyme F420 hydrogenase subunit beta